MVSLYALGTAALVVVILVIATLAIVPPRSVWLGLRSFERRTGAPPAAMLVAGTVGLLVLGAGIAAANAGGGEFDLVDGLFTIVGALGPLSVAVGLAARSPKNRLAAASETRTGSPGSGAVAVDGDLRAAERTFGIPDGDEALQAVDDSLGAAADGAVTCAYVLKKERGVPSRSRVWATIAEGERTLPLAVDDGSGEVRVDHETVTVRSGRLGDRGYTIDLPEGENVPEDVTAFLAEVGVESPGTPSADHRLKLRPLVPGDSVTAVGTYERVTRAGEAFWGITDGDGPAYLYAGDRDRVAAILRRRTRWLTAVGAAFTFVGVGYLATAFGVLP
ncbi:MAG: hypothetical protein ABEH90_01870 [Halolamina sp.]